MPPCEAAYEDVVLEKGDASEKGEEGALSRPGGQGGELGCLTLAHVQHTRRRDSEILWVQWRGGGVWGIHQQVIRPEVAALLYPACMQAAAEARLLISCCGCLTDTMAVPQTQATSLCCSDREEHALQHVCMHIESHVLVGQLSWYIC